MLAAANEMKVASRMLTRGQLRVNMEMVGSQEPIHLLANMVNRLTMALIVVGLFIGSSIVYYAGIKPVIFGIPIVGFLGYVIAFILSVWIVFDIYFKGRRSASRASCVAGGLCCGALAFVLVIAFISAFAIAFAFPDYSIGHGFLLNNQTSCQ